MKNSLIIIPVLITVLMIPSLLLAVERAPRISDREIVERLTKLEEGQKHLCSQMNSRFEDLRSEVNSRFGAIDKRFDILQWMLGLFRNVDELTSTSRRIDLGQICSISDHKS